MPLSQKCRKEAYRINWEDLSINREQSNQIAESEERWKIALRMRNDDKDEATKIVNYHEEKNNRLIER